MIAMRPGRIVPRSFAAAQLRLETTMEWLDYDPQTQKKNAALIERFMNMRVDPERALKWRDVPVEYLDADRLRAIIEGIFSKNRTVAKHMLVAIKKLLWVSIEVEKWIKPQDDPSLSIRVRVPKSKKNPAWPIAIREQFEARHPIGTAARTCYALGFWLGNRRGDIADLLWDELVTEEIELFDGSLVMIDAFDFRQKKNSNRHGGREMFIPVVDKLAEALAPLDRSNGGTVLKNGYGEPFSEKSLTGMMAHWERLRRALLREKPDRDDGALDQTGRYPGRVYAPWPAADLRHLSGRVQHSGPDDHGSDGALLNDRDRRLCPGCQQKKNGRRYRPSHQCPRRKARSDEAPGEFANRQRLISGKKRGNDRAPSGAFSFARGPAVGNGVGKTWAKRQKGQ
ncbi:hypothetical protein [Sinorhizobium medicae]|uniref:hypothetical protein n=1 Tax=Sinorhizobium medicae TaxID=110321 RepID=UPI003C742951